MYSKWRSFNGFLALVFLALAMGCHTAEPKPNSDRRQRKELSTLRFCLEMAPDGTDRVKIISVIRSTPIPIGVATTPVLNENDIESAAVVEAQGVFGIRVKLNARGTRILEMVSGSYPGQRLAILSQFGPERWLAAPKMNHLISDGIIEFTPDASREEADRIVRGLNNLVAKVKKLNRF